MESKSIDLRKLREEAAARAQIQARLEGRTTEGDAPLFASEFAASGGKAPPPPVGRQSK